MSQDKDTNKENQFFLPDFCQVESVFIIILTGEILAIIFTLLQVKPTDAMWETLGLYSISVQIISLVSVTTLCWLRPWLGKFSDAIAGALSLIIILLTTLIFSLAAIDWYWLASIDLSNIAQRHLLIRNLIIAGLIGGVALRYLYLQQQYHRQLQMESAARLEALQARIRPHFLFNSMNVIASLTRIDPEKAEMAIQDLSDLFRATLESNDGLVSFAQELENGERYLSIEKLRLGERLKVVKDIDSATLNVMIPPLTVQPILENAVYHGIQMLPDGGEVFIRSSVLNNKQTNNTQTTVQIEISNPISAEKYHKGHGIALKNIEQRLSVVYQGKALLRTEESDSIYRVILSIPLKLE